MVYEHGGDVYRNKVRLDFSVNTNPLGMSENVKKAIAENIEQFGIYPDAMCINLRNAIAEKEQVGIDNVLCSNGAAEMIFAVVRAVMPKKTLLLAPTFSEYERALKSVGSQICYYYLKEKNDFELQDDFIDYLFVRNGIFYLIQQSHHFLIIAGHVFPQIQIPIAVLIGNIDISDFLYDQP